MNLLVSHLMGLFSTLIRNPSPPLRIRTDPYLLTGHQTESGRGDSRRQRRSWREAITLGARLRPECRVSVVRGEGSPPTSHRALSRPRAQGLHAPIRRKGDVHTWTNAGAVDVGSGLRVGPRAGPWPSNRRLPW